MCGILAYLSVNHKQKISTFSEALKLQENRGPDDSGIYYLENNKLVEAKNEKSSDLVSSFIVGHNRLSIIDPSKKSRQPVLEDRKILSYNGEFYNFKDHSISKYKNSDTLTLFHNLKNHGIKFLDNVNGMWALFYGDLEHNEFFFARDRYGKKPLYYYKGESFLIISSEIKSIFHILNKKRIINKRALAFYLVGKLSPYLSDGNTFYKNIKAVKPGHILNFNFSKNKISLYKTIGFYEKTSNTLDYTKVRNQLFEELNDSVKLRLTSDAIIGLQISGGVDSSLIAGFAAQNLQDREKLKFYTCHIIDKNNKVNRDLYYSRVLAKELNFSLNEVSINPNDKNLFLKIHKKISKSCEIPINIQLSTVPTYLISQKMKNDGVKVAIDGVGGDEVLGGYPKFDKLIIANLRSKKYLNATKLFINKRSFENLNLNKTLFSILRLSKEFFKNSMSVFEVVCRDFLNLVVDKELKNNLILFSTNYFFRDGLDNQKDRQLFEIQKYNLPFYLGIADSVNMINSIENRSPFLDYRLFKYIFMNENYKINRGFNKYILRDCVPSNVPDSIKWRRQKFGMTNVFSNDNFFTKESLEMIMDSNFINSFIKDKDLLMKKFSSKSNIILQFLSLAVLDDHYDLYLN